MIECIFTIDYEIYGNGKGSLKELVYEPTERLMSIFMERNATFVVFAEALEFMKIEEHRSDEGIGKVRGQLGGLLEKGFEIGLHLHPWWWNAKRANGDWQLAWTERNLCEMPEQRIDDVVRNSVEYLRAVTGQPGFTPVSFRGGLWLIQPTETMAKVLAKYGLKVDSSVFKGGRIQDVGVDYRPSMRNGYYWRFGNDVNRVDPNGKLLEVPIHTEMVPFWKMLSGKRLSLHKKVPAANGNGTPLGNRWGDYARFRYPRKLDFCRMSLDEMRSVMNALLKHDKESPEVYKPVVAIGHSKDLVDFDAIREFLNYLEENKIVIGDFRQVLKRLQHQHG
jgi:peptidoglycan/xylan/chitin deacetylase (PgdA/CDA1 family)